MMFRILKAFFNELENKTKKKKTKNYEDLGYKSSLWKQSRFKPFCG